MKANFVNPSARNFSSRNTKKKRKLPPGHPLPPGHVKKRAKKHNPRSTTMAKKKKHHPRKRARRHNPAAAANPRKRKRKAPRAVYKTSATGTRRRTRRSKRSGLLMGSKHGRRRRVRRVNPGMPAILSNGLAAVAGFATGVVVRVGTHMAAPGNAMAAKALGAIGFVGGLLLASKHPAYGIGVAVGSLDAALQNDAVFKAEMALAPAATAKGLGAIQYNNMRGMVNARSIPQFARMSGLPAYARINGMGAIAADTLSGYGSDQIGAMKVRNPFE